MHLFLHPLAIIKLLSLWTCLFWKFHLNGIIQYVALYVCLLSFNIIFSRFTHVLRCIIT